MTVEEAWTKHRKRVWSVCYRMVKNQDDADDLTQLVFLRLVRKIGTFRGDCLFTGWLHRIAVNTVLMELRRRKARPTVSLEVTEEEGEEKGTDAYQRAVSVEDRQLKSTGDRITVTALMERLRPEEKTIILLYDIEGYSHEEISEMLGIGIGSSKSRLLRARAQMGRLAGIEYREPEGNDNLVFSGLEQFLLPAEAMAQLTETQIPLQEQSGH